MRKNKSDIIQKLIIEDILDNYPIDSRYRTIRDIAETFSISLQTAAKIVSNLTENGILSTKPRSGIRVLRSPAEIDAAVKIIFFFFRNVSPERALSSVDYAAKHTITPSIVTTNMSVENSFIIYDSKKLWPAFRIDSIVVRMPTRTPRLFYKRL